MSLISIDHYRETLLSKYQDKLTNPVDALKKFTRKAKFVTFGCYGAAPVALSKAFTSIAQTGFYENAIDVYLFRCSDEVALNFANADVLKHMRLLFPFAGGGVMNIIKEARASRAHETFIKPEFVPGHFSRYEFGYHSQEGTPDVHLMQVSPMDDKGYFSFGVDGTFSIHAAREAKHVIIEVNPNMPRTFGDGIIHLNDVSAIVEHTSEILPMKEKTGTDVDSRIAEQIAAHIPDRACLQLGIGGIPNYLGKFLTQKNDLSVHTELLNSSLVDLMINGNVTNRYKEIDPFHSVYNVAMLPSAEYYSYMDNNPSLLCCAATYVNNPGVIREISHMISVNSFIEIDLFGQVASESINWRQLTGTGGQVDFVRGASRSRDGKSFLAANSTAKNGTISKIVPRLDNIVTTGRNDIQYIATEFGCFNLAGMSDRARALALIELSHPDFRPFLKEEAEKMDLI